MPAARQQVAHFDQFAGMNRNTRPHLLPPQAWRTALGVRIFESNIKQVPPKKVLHYALQSSKETLLNLTSIPTNYEDNAFVVGLTESSVLRVTDVGARKLKKGAADAAMTAPTSGYMRWGTCVYNEWLFFVNELNAVHLTDGAVVKAIGGDAPAGRYVEVFFDHLVVGAPLYKGEKLLHGIRWSHLYDFTNFKPDTHTEADLYICSDYQRDTDASWGVTGLRKMGNECYIYTPHAVFRMQYTGLPRIVRVDPVVTDHGNGLMYGVASIGNLHFFVDIYEKTFFAFNGQSLEDVGLPIKDYFFSDVNSDFALQQRTWCYVNKEFKEVVWVYVSTASSGEFDKAVAFNYREKKWTVRPVENIHSYCGATGLARTCKELTGKISDYAGTAGSLGDSGKSVKELWGGANTRVLVEATSTDPTTQLLYVATPSLETGDYIYDSVQNVKEVDSVNVQAAYSACKGVEVELSTRKLVDGAVTFEKVGTWTPALTQERLTFKGRSGKVLRWRFNPLPDTLPFVKTVRKTGLSTLQLRAGALLQGSIANITSGGPTGFPVGNVYFSAYVASSGTDSFTKLSAAQQQAALFLFDQEWQGSAVVPVTVSAVYWASHIYAPGNYKSIVRKTDAGPPWVAGQAPGEGTVAFSLAPWVLAVWYTL